MKERFFENLQFATLALLNIAQCTVGANFYFGPCLYLLANIVSVARCFILARPMADKVKDIACFAITLGLIIFNYLR